MKVNDFLTAIKGHRGEPTTAGVHRLIAETAADLPARTIHQPLHPDAVERAYGVLTELLPFTREPHKRHRLPDDYFRLAVDFIDSYRLRAKADGSIRPNASIKREKALRRTLRKPRSATILKACSSRSGRCRTSSVPKVDDPPEIDSEPPRLI